VSENLQIHSKIEIMVDKTNSISVEHYSGNKGVLFTLSISNGEGIQWINLYDEDIDKLIKMLQQAKELIK
jgi:hypothetical protein